MIIAMALLFACGSDPEVLPPAPAPPPSPLVALPSPPDPQPAPHIEMPERIQDPTSIASLFTESSTPTTEGIRTPPPRAYQRQGPAIEPIGEGWATHDGDLCVLVTQDPEGWSLTLIDAERHELASLPFEGYPDEAWWSPRWSRSGRHLALGSMSGDLVDITVFDIASGAVRQVATAASGFSWSSAGELAVISYWPAEHAPFPQPQFHFYRADLDRTWVPMAPTEEVGWVFTGFTAQGEVLYREHRRATVEGKITWDPVGERADRLTPKPPPGP
ncbi:MAG: hypothetical protein ABIO70_25140 [Pseudomonadota bacterium]